MEYLCDKVVDMSKYKVVINFIWFGGIPAPLFGFGGISLPFFFICVIGVMIATHDNHRRKLPHMSQALDYGGFDRSWPSFLVRDIIVRWLCFLDTIIADYAVFMKRC